MKTWGYKTIIAVFLYSVLISCRKNVQNIKNEKNKIVVLAEITAGDSAIIPVSKSIAVGNGETVSFEKITTASVTITDATGPVQTLRWNNSNVFLNNPATIYTHPALFKSNQTYSLQINQTGLETINATTHIPAPFSVSDVEADENERNGKKVLEFNFTIHDNSNEKNYYLFEALKQLVSLSEYFFWQGVKYDYNTPEGQIAYKEAKRQQSVDIFKDTVLTNKYIRLNLFTSDTQTDNEDFGSLDSSFHRVFLSDSSFNGSNYKSSFAVDQSYFEAKVPEEKGIILIRVKSVSRELFDYLSQYEKYRTEFGIRSPASLASPSGNILNGLGVFGGSYKNEWIYYYDEL